MESGLLKDKITFQKMTVTVDVYGHEITTYTDAFTTRTDVIWNNGERLISNDEVFYSNTVQFIVRFYCPVEDTMRIKYQDKLYRIISINPDRDLYKNKTIITELINE